MMTSTRIPSTFLALLLLALIAMGLYVICVQNIPLTNSTTVVVLNQNQAISSDINEVYDAEIDSLLSNVVVDPSYSHALEEHPNSAPLVHECMKNQGPYMQFQIHKDERYLRVCIIDEDKGTIGFQIVDIVERVAKERTAYVKNGFNSIRDVLDYAARRGYCRFKGPL